MSETIIRDAEYDDCERLVELIVDLGHPITLDHVRANLRKLRVLRLSPLVAEIDGRVVGLCVPSIMQTLHRETPVGRISTMVVDASCRSGGVGAQLVKEAESRLAASGCALIEVTSNESRDRAHNFYEKLGYRRTSKRFAKTL